MTTLPLTLDRCPECGQPPAEPGLALLGVVTAAGVVLGAALDYTAARRRRRALAALHTADLEREHEHLVAGHVVADAPATDQVPAEHPVVDAELVEPEPPAEP